MQCVKALAKLRKTNAELAESAAACVQLPPPARRCRDHARRAGEGIPTKTLGRIDATTAKLDRKLDAMLPSFPMRSGWLLDLLLGSANVTLPHKSDRFKYKKDFETHKLYATYVIIAASSAAAYWPVPVAEVCFHSLLLIYYAIVILRERVLIANGSRIRKWWRVHTYIAILISALLLSWPTGVAYERFHLQFSLYSLCVGVRRPRAPPS